MLLCESTAAETANDRQRMNFAGNENGKWTERGPQERPTQRAAESGPQEAAGATHTEGRRTHTGNTQTVVINNMVWYIMQYRGSRANNIE